MLECAYVLEGRTPFVIEHSESTANHYEDLPLITCLKELPSFPSIFRSL